MLTIRPILPENLGQLWIYQVCDAQHKRKIAFLFIISGLCFDIFYHSNNDTYQKYNYLINACISRGESDSGRINQKVMNINELFSVFDKLLFWLDGNNIYLCSGKDQYLVMSSPPFQT